MNSNKKMFANYHTKQRLTGFTLIEIIVVIGIITIAMMGISSLVLQNIRSQTISSNYLIASMLAQEGLELVRNHRDSNWLNGANDLTWAQGGGTGLISISPNGPGNSYYTIDYNGTIANLDVADFIGLVASRLYFNSGYFDHDNSGELTLFYRVIKIIDNDDQKINVKSHIRWSERGKTFNYIAETYLYNWR